MVIFLLALLASVEVRGVREDPSDRARDLLNKMTLEDKITMCHGVQGPNTGNVLGNAKLGIPPLNLQDGRQGVRAKDGVTAWPSQVTIVTTWDRDLMRQFGNGMGEEFYGKGCNVALAPMLILARVPQGGRIFESVGEDPYLASQMAYAEITGIQEKGVIANADDYVLNNQETDRNSISAVCDERTLHELYYPGYQGAVDANVGSFMCSYNRVNGTWACENNQTLHVDLKGTMGFKGWVLSDWGGCHSTVPSALAGFDMEMPGDTFYGQALEDSVEKGEIPQEVLDDMLMRILTPMFATGLFDVPNNGTMDTNVTSAAHVQLARKLGTEGTVLLKNGKNPPLLPLDATALHSLAVIGDAGDKAPLCCGTGSGNVMPPYVISPFAGLKERAGPEVNVTYAPTPTSSQSLAEMTALAAAADVAVVCVGVEAGEGGDRANLSLGQAQDDMIMSIAQVQPNTIVAINNPGAVLMPWIDSVSAVLAFSFPGQELGHVIADVIFGDATPGGRLPLTFPVLETDTPLKTPEQFPGVNGVVTYSEKLLMGYRWFDATSTTPLFPFGHGLSYSNFIYDALHITVDDASGNVTVSLSVTNTGALDSSDVVQLYLAYPAAAGEPPKVLRGFSKIRLSPKQAANVTFVLCPSVDMRVWDEDKHTWKIICGEFGLMVGSSSRDIKQQNTFSNNHC